jgi:branched-chain amino acid transport system permease protein
VTLLISQRLQGSRIGRAWMAIRGDELAAEAMGIHTRNLKLPAFAIGASFGGVAGAMFSTVQGFISPEAFSPQESVLIVAMVVFGGIGHIPCVILGAVLLTALPEALRHLVNPLQETTGGRLDAGILRQLLVALVMIIHGMCWLSVPAFSASRYGFEIGPEQSLKNPLGLGGGLASVGLPTRWLPRQNA